jgi:alpha-tubulin suppressor-like RCC1 family protein
MLGGFNHTILTQQDSNGRGIYMVGNNSLGQAGNFNPYTNLVQKTSDNDISKVITNNDSTFFQKTDDTLWAVGANSFGQFMSGNITSRSSPVQITNNWGTINNPVAYDIKQGSSIIITK